MSSRDIQAELRATAPPAPDALRARVHTIVAQERAPRRRPAFTPWRASFALAGALLVAGVGAAVVHSLTSDGNGKVAGSNYHSIHDLEVPGAATSTTAQARTEKRINNAAGADQALRLRAAAAADAARRAAIQQHTGALLAPSTLPPAGFRLQDYDVSLGVRVANSAALAKATVAAMRWTRAFGGYVARVSYDTPRSSRGEAYLVLRVPVGKVQDAMQRFSGLGTLTSQHVAIQDLQGTVNAQTKRIIVLNRRIGAILKELDGGSLTVDRQARLQAELSARKQELAAVTGQKRATVVQGRLAHVYLTLATKAKAKQHVAIPHKPGRIERRLDDAGSVLAQELAVLLYGLVVVAPFALLGAALLGAARMQRRRTDRRVLARS